MEKLHNTNITSFTQSGSSRSITAKTVITASVLSIISAFLGQGCIFDELYPFGFAIITAAPGIYSFACFVGTSIGLLFSQTGIYLFRYIICAAALWIIRSRIFKPTSRLGNVWFASSGVCFVVCALTGIAVVIPTGNLPEEIIRFISEGVIASFLSFFYRISILKITRSNEKFFTSKELLCLGISFSTVIAALSNIKLSFFSPAEFIALFITLCVCFVMNETGGAVFCCICAAALSTDIYSDYNIFPLICAGVVSGIFSPLGKIPAAVSFLFAFSASSLWSGDDFIYYRLISCAASCLIFILIPNKLYRKISAYLKTKEVTASESTYRKDVSGKLSHTADAVDSICLGMNKVSENLKKIDSNYDRNIFCRVRQEVCEDCESKEKCWSQCFSHTLRGFDEISQNCRHTNTNFSPFAVSFLKKCPHNKRLLSSIQTNCKKYDESVRDEIQLDEKRVLINEQMKCMSDILKDFSENFSRCSLVDNELSQKIKTILNSFSVRCTKALCIIGSDGNMTIKAYCKKIDSTVDRKKLKEAIEQASLRKFNNADIDFTENGTVVIYRQKPWMKMKTGKIQLSSDESPICGDCLKEITDEYGNRSIILSDGMGTGGRAAVDAAITAEYFSDLLEGNISPDNALRIINTVLSVKSTNESLSTIDLAKFNLFSGKVEFFKAGAAASFVRKNGKCKIIEGASLPAGIIHDISFTKENITLSKGDIAVMVSDGVTNGSTQWIMDEIEKFNLSNPELLAQKIAGIVCDKSKGERRDDITVFVGIMTA